MTNGKEFSKLCLDNMDFESIYQMGKELESDRYDTVDFHGPKTIEDKEIGEYADFVYDYLEEHYAEEMKKIRDEEMEEAQIEGELYCKYGV